VTEEQLIVEIRRELDRELAHIELTPGQIETAWDQPETQCGGGAGEDLRSCWQRRSQRPQ
jgi:hypothetical protein